MEGVGQGVFYTAMATMFYIQFMCLVIFKVVLANV